MGVKVRIMLETKALIESKIFIPKGTILENKSEKIKFKTMRDAPTGFQTIYWGFLWKIFHIRPPEYVKVPIKLM